MQESPVRNYRYPYSPAADQRLQAMSNLSEVGFHVPSFSMFVDNCCAGFDKCYSKIELVKPTTTVVNEHPNQVNLSEVGFHVPSFSMFVDNRCARFDQCCFRRALAKPKITIVH